MQVYNALIERIQALAPEHVELENESMSHAGYFEGKESHFKLTVVSEQFASHRAVARHQLIYQLVNGLMMPQGGTIHALAIHAYTPDEWHQLLQDKRSVPASPQCAGQNKSS